MCEKSIGRGFSIEMHPLYHIHSGREMGDGVGLLSPVLGLLLRPEPGRGHNEWRQRMKKMREKR